MPLSYLRMLKIHFIGLPGMAVSVSLMLALLGAPASEAQTLEEAMVALERRDYPVAFEVFRALAEQGNAEAQNNLRLISSEGDEVPQDFTKTEQGVVFVISVILIILLINIRRWTNITIRRAAKRGDAEAQFNLGLMYAEGRGVREDAREAVRWFRRAAEQDHARAQWWLRLRGLVEDDP